MSPLAAGAHLEDELFERVRECVDVGALCELEHELAREHVAIGVDPRSAAEAARQLIHLSLASLARTFAKPIADLAPLEVLEDDEECAVCRAFGLDDDDCS